MNDDFDFKQKIMNAVIFISIIILLITSVFNIHLLFLEEPEYNCYKYNYPHERNIDCDYNLTEINECQAKNGNIIYQADCSVVCDLCYAEEQVLRNSINEKKAWFRIILSLALLLVFGYINIKDKIVQYALLIGSLIALVVSTIISLSYISKKLFPIVTILELVVILILYKVLFKKK
jgi:hypothetical protein